MQESSISFFARTTATGGACYRVRSALQIVTRPDPFLPALSGRGAWSKRKYQLLNCHAAGTRSASLTLLVGLLMGPLQAHGAMFQSRQSAAEKAQASLINELRILARDRAKDCINEKITAPPIPGWSESAVQCAWQNRLQMRRWETAQYSDPGSCLSRPAQWWAWARIRATRPVGPPAWNSAWTAQSLADDAGAPKRVGIIERAANGRWVATEWRWDPSPRMATRKWQEERWKLLLEAAGAMRQHERDELTARELAPLKAAWEKNLNGRAGEVSSESWLWQRDGLCLRMETAGLSQAQLHLPYAREDGRLEQRSAMQIQLARTYPNATWLTPFRLLPLPNASARRGAKYEAIWIEQASVKGQLWMPRPDGTILRARIATALPQKQGGAGDAAAASAGIARAVDLELIGLATAWAQDYER